MNLTKLLPDNIAMPYDFKLDFDPYSIDNVICRNPNMDIVMAEAVSEASHRQVIRNCIKKELCDYFYDLYINDDDKPKRCGNQN